MVRVVFGKIVHVTILKLYIDLLKIFFKIICSSHFKIFFLKNAKNGFSSKKSVHDCVGLKTKVTASRLTKKYVKSTFEKKKMELSPHLF